MTITVTDLAEEERPDVFTMRVGDTDSTPDASRITPPVLLPGFPNPVALCPFWTRR